MAFAQPSDALVAALEIKDANEDEKTDIVKNKGMKPAAVKYELNQLTGETVTLVALASATEENIEREITILTRILADRGVFDAAKKTVNGKSVYLTIIRIQQLKIRLERIRKEREDLTVIEKKEKKDLEAAEKEEDAASSSEIISDVVDDVLGTVEALEDTKSRVAKQNIINAAQTRITELQTSGEIGKGQPMTGEYVERIVKELQLELEKVELSLKQSEGEEEKKKVSLLRKTVEILKTDEDRIKEPDAHKKEHKNVFEEVDETPMKRKIADVATSLREIVADHRNDAINNKSDAATRKQTIQVQRRAREDTKKAHASTLPLGIVTSLVRRYLDPHLADDSRAMRVPVQIALPESPKTMWQGMALKTPGVASIDDKGNAKRFYYYSIFLDRTAAVPMAEMPRPNGTGNQPPPIDAILILLETEKVAGQINTLEDDFTETIDGGEGIPYHMAAFDNGVHVIVNHWEGQKPSVARRILVAVPVAIMGEKEIGFGISLNTTALDEQTVVDEVLEPSDSADE